MLKPLTFVPGLGNWSSYLGDGSHSATLALTLSASDFARRWSVASTSTSARNGLAVVADGLVINVVSDSSQGGPTLIARREHDGSEVWRRALGTVNDIAGGPTVAAGSVYVFTSDYDRTVLWRADLATGQLLGQQTVGGHTTNQAAPLALDGKLFTCRKASSGGSGSGLSRYDGLTLTAEATLTLPLGVDNCAPAAQGTRLYLFANKSLIAVDTTSGQLAYDIPVEGVPAYATATPVLDNAGRVFVSLYSQDSQSDRTSRLMALRRQHASVAVAGDGRLQHNAGRVRRHSFHCERPQPGSPLCQQRRAAVDLAEQCLNAWRYGERAGRHPQPCVRFQPVDHGCDRPVHSHTRLGGENIGGALALSPQGVLYIVPYFTGGMRAINLR